MNIFQKHLQKTPYILSILVILYFVSRLINLRIIPIFTDEAIYSYWAQVALNDPANRFISLTDGKQPLFIWLAAISQIFIKDPLIATRMVSVFAGFGSLVGIYFLGKALFEQKSAFIASALYILLPFPLLYDRMALYDSLLTMLCIWVVLFTVKLAKKPQLDIAFANGTALGMGLITKSSANFFLYMLPISLIFINFRRSSKINYIKYFFFLTVTGSIALVIYNCLRLSPYFYIIAQKNASFIRSFNEVSTNPFEYFIPNVKSILGWVYTYSQLPLILLFIFGSIRGILKKNLSVLYLLILITVPFVAEALFNKILYPRFVLFYYPFFILINAYILVQIWEAFSSKKIWVTLILILAVALPAYKSIKIITEPVKAGIPTGDANQYLNDWPAGYGVKEVVQILRQESSTQKVYVGTEGTFGLLPYALNIYFQGNNNLSINSFWPVSPSALPVQVTENAKKEKTFFLFNENQTNIEYKNLKLVGSYRKGSSNSFMRLYQVLP